MKLHVHYFAAFREATGLASEHVDTVATTPGALFGECATRHPRLQRFTSSLVAVNDEMTGWDAVLSEGDRVLFFPPVAGG